MLNYFSIKDKIKNLVDNGEKKFVIYPYGKNGKDIEQLLINEFALSPILIVDNFMCERVLEIISGEELSVKYKKDYYIILTVENEQVNREILKSLEEFCEKSHIINVLNIGSGRGDYSLPEFRSFRLNSLLDSKKIIRNTGKIKVRILNFSQATWNSLHTICSACNLDTEIDLLIIMGEKNNSSVMCQVMEKEKYHYIKIDQYKVELDKPDILLISHPYDIFSSIKDCRKYCKLIIVASMQLVRYSHNWNVFLQQQIAGFGRFYPDFYLFDSLLYHDMVRAGFDCHNIFEMGNAKFDGIFHAMKTHKYPSNWSKLAGKKVILWTTDHGVHDGNITKDVTLDLYGQFLFQFAKENKNIGFIFRPHKTLISELLTAGLWTEQDLEELRVYCDASDNIIFDESLTYDAAFGIADGIITDAYCGITCSALPLLKPMCLLYRDKIDIPYHKEIEECSYEARSDSEIQKFIYMVLEGKDEKLLLRKQNTQKCIKNFDGKNGERIKDFLKQKYRELYG